MNIFVGNLNFKASVESLERAFAQYGEVSSCKIVTDRETGKAKGFGFVDMPDDSEAKAAIEGLNGSDFMGRNMIVNAARPRA